MAYRCRNDGRHPNQIYLGIDPEVLKLPGVRFSFGVANATNAKIIAIEEALKLHDFDEVYGRWGNGKNFIARLSEAEKFEVLIPGGIPVKYIKKKLTPS